MLEIGTEYEMIEYMVKHWHEYFNNFAPMATEVSFKGALKDVDMVGENIWEYILMEFKRGDVSEEDFYNIKQIIDNNKYNKPIKGLLIGTGISTMILEKVELEKDIDYLIIGDLIYNKKINNDGKKKKYIIDKRGKIKDLALFFASSIGHDNMNIKAEKDYLFLKYKLSNGNEVDIALNDDGFCLIEVFENSGMQYDRWNKISEFKRTRYCNIDEIIYDLENKNYINEMKRTNNYLKENIKYLSSIGLISKYVEINKSVYRHHFDNNILKTDFENGIMFIPSFKNYGYYIYPLKYSFLLLTKLEKEKIYDIDLYNIITVLECTRLILNNKVYKPLIKVTSRSRYTILDFTLKLNNGKKIGQTYKVESVKEIINFELYLIANIDIILDFEGLVKKNLKNKVTVDEKYNDFIGTNKYKKFRNPSNKNHKAKSIRDIIENITEDDIHLMNRYKL